MSMLMPTSSFSMRVSNFFENKSAKTNWDPAPTTGTATATNAPSWAAVKMDSKQQIELGRALRNGDAGAAQFFVNMTSEEKIELLQNELFARKLMKGAADGTLAPSVRTYLATADGQVKTFSKANDVWTNKSGYLMHRSQEEVKVVLKFLVDDGGKCVLPEIDQKKFVDSLLPKRSMFDRSSTPLTISKEAQKTLLGCLDVFESSVKVKILTAFVNDSEVLANADVIDAAVRHLPELRSENLESRLPLAEVLVQKSENFAKAEFKRFVADVVGDLENNQIHANKGFLDTVAKAENLEKVLSDDISATQKIGLLKTLSGDANNLNVPEFRRLLDNTIGALSPEQIADATARPMAIELANTLSGEPNKFREQQFKTFVSNLIGTLDADSVSANAKHLKTLMGNVVNHFAILKTDNGQQKELATGLSTFAQTTDDLTRSSDVAKKLFVNDVNDVNDVQLITLLSAEQKAGLANVLSQSEPNFSEPAFVRLMASVVSHFSAANIAENKDFVSRVMDKSASFNVLTNAEKMVLVGGLSQNSANFENANFQKFILDLKSAVTEKEIVANKEFWLTFIGALGKAINANGPAFSDIFRNEIAATRAKFSSLEVPTFSRARFDALPLYKREALGAALVVGMVAVTYSLFKNDATNARWLFQLASDNLSRMPAITDWTSFFSSDTTNVNGTVAQEVNRTIAQEVNRTVAQGINETLFDPKTYNFVNAAGAGYIV